jgi:hypothetical protein
MLEIVLVEQKPVQPYYFIAPEHRKSVSNERKAQRDIKRALFRKYPGSKTLVLPTIYVHTADIAIDEEIAQANKEAFQIEPMGRQYEFLARYCKQKQITDLELCWENLRDANALSRYLPLLEQIGDTQMFRYSRQLTDRPESHIFKFFLFPISLYTKEEMWEMARVRGWQGIMRKTWFCHTPLLGKIPCGVCVPCRHAITEGMAWRIPFYTRYLHKVWDTKLVRLLRKVLRPKRREKQS